MRAGPMRERLVIQRATTTQDGYGEPIETWATHATRWAQVEPLRGAERFEAQRLNPDLAYRVRVRHDTTVDGVTPKDRIYWTRKTRTLRIHEVINIGARDREVQLICSELVET